MDGGREAVTHAPLRTWPLLGRAREALGLVQGSKIRSSILAKIAPRRKSFSCARLRMSKSRRYLQHPPRNGGIGMPINSLPLSHANRHDGRRRTEIPEGRRIFRNRRRRSLQPERWARSFGVGRRRGGGAKLKDAPTDMEYGPRSGREADERRPQVNRNRKAKRSRRSRRKPKSYHMKQTIGCCP